jgi:hypothetical protein
MQPLITRLALHHHRIFVVNQPVTDTTCAVIGSATALRRRRGCGRAVEGVGVRIVVAGVKRHVG